MLQKQLSQYQISRLFPGPHFPRGKRLVLDPAEGRITRNTELANPLVHSGRWLMCSFSLISSGCSLQMQSWKMALIKNHEGPCISAYPARTYRNKRPRQNCLPTSAHVCEKKIHSSHKGTDRKTCNDKRNLLTTSTNNHTLPKINYTNSHVLQK